ncbi:MULTISPECIES: hypothetical protein [Streptomyces]|uniref:Transposase (putative) YhgA-like domain-containing protein n=1 Tax=Streptomyces rubrolavendulae TaxID=285473 RepID=A0A1D8G4U6_9ACTN|nr:hypothetical protein [Streptomyces rubrolavendulae]AOT60486.1 hypothetical protein A4G23_03361 [Streptomyces rubrolavendulae]
MVSSPHEAMHRIFQEYPELFSRVSEVLGIDLPRPHSVRILPTDLTESRPVERRVDTLLHFETESDGGFLVAVEAQGRKDPGKPGSWAYYVTYLYEKYGLPPLLLVVCQDRATADWAAVPVRIGPAGWTTLLVHPLVVGPHNMPVITDVADARKDLSLTALSAITHASDPEVGAILKALSTALRDEPESLVNPVIEFVAQGLGKRPASEIWRNLVAVDLSFYTSPLSEEIRAQGEARRAARDVLTVLKQRGLEVPEVVRERITDTQDLELLHLWLVRAVTASSTDELFCDE